MMRSLTILTTALLLAAGVSAALGAEGLFGGSRRDEPVARTAPIALPAGDRLVESLQQRLDRTPDDARTLTRLGLAYLQQARETAEPSAYGRAETALRRALQLVPQDPEAMRGLGELAVARHDFAGALDWVERALAVEPESAGGLGVLGDALLELGRYDEAFAAFQRMVDLKPDLNSLARASYARELTGDTVGAIEAMREAAEAGGARGEPVAWARVQLGHLYFGAGDLASAEAEYRRSLQTLPGYVYGRAGLGRAAAARGDYGGAITHYQSAIERVAIPEFVIALGDVYRAAGREDEARAQYELVDAIDRLYKANGVNTDLELALFYADRDLRLDEALRQARAQYEQRHTVYTADVLAWALYQNGRPEEAKPYSDEALRLGTRDARLLFHAGMIARTLGDAERARSLLARALETNPHFSLLHHDEAQRALAELEESEALAERGD